MHRVDKLQSRVDKLVTSCKGSKTNCVAPEFDLYTAGSQQDFERLTGDLYTAGSQQDFEQLTGVKVVFDS